MEEKKRLFFALVPPDFIKKQIFNIVSRLDFDLNVLALDKSRFVDINNYHITLQFLGDVAIDSVRSIIAHASRIDGKCFELKIDEVGYFKRSHVLWFGPKGLPIALEYLVDGIRVNTNNIEGLNHTKSINKQYNPHITIVKKIADISSHPRVLKTNVDITWSIDRFYLVESVVTNDNVRYEELAEFVFSS